MNQSPKMLCQPTRLEADSLTQRAVVYLLIDCTQGLVL